MTRSSAATPDELLMLLADTGPLVAVANSRDQHHDACQELLETTPVRSSSPHQ